MNGWPYSPKMERARKWRLLRGKIAKYMTVERTLNIVLVGFFIFMTLIYIFAPWRS